MFKMLYTENIDHIHYKMWSGHGTCAVC